MAYNAINFVHEDVGNFYLLLKKGNAEMTTKTQTIMTAGIMTAEIISVHLN